MSREIANKTSQTTSVIKIKHISGTEMQEGNEQGEGINLKIRSAIHGWWQHRKRRIRRWELGGNVSPYAEAHFRQRCRDGCIRVRLGVHRRRAIVAVERPSRTSDSISGEAVVVIHYTVI